jgi:hypothetical protein
MLPYKVPFNKKSNNTILLETGVISQGDSVGVVRM